MLFLDIKKCFKYESRAGFTVIELLVVIAIITVLPAIVISNFPQIQKQFAISRAVYKFSQDIRSVQDMALSSLPYKDQFGESKEVSGYGIYVDINVLGNKKYILYADNNDNQASNKEYDELDYIVSEIDFSLTESEIVIKEINNVYNNSVSINFNPPNPDTTITELNQGANKVDIVFAVGSDLTRTRTVSINTVGLIEVK